MHISIVKHCWTIYIYRFNDVKLYIYRYNTIYMYTYWDLRKPFKSTPCVGSLANIKAMAPRPLPQRNRVLCELQRLKLLRREAQGSEAGVVSLCFMLLKNANQAWSSMKQGEAAYLYQSCLTAGRVHHRLPLIGIDSFWYCGLFCLLFFLPIFLFDRVWCAYSSQVSAAGCWRLFTWFGNALPACNHSRWCFISATLYVQTWRSHLLDSSTWVLHVIHLSFSVECSSHHQPKMSSEHKKH